MAKIEELTELLVNELDSFEKGVERFEKVSDKLHTAKISIDIKEYKLLLDNHQMQMRAVLDAQERIFNRYEKLLKDAKVYSNWAVIVFITSLILCFSSLFYAYTVKLDYDNIEKATYDKGVNTYDEYLQDFFKGNPKTHKEFKK